jgi:hypothetical protein
VGQDPVTGRRPLPEGHRAPRREDLVPLFGPMAGVIIQGW